MYCAARRRRCAPPACCCTGAEPEEFNLPATPQICAGCGLRNSSLHRRCARCGQALGGAAEAATTEPDLRPPTFTFGESDAAVAPAPAGKPPAGGVWAASPRALTADLTLPQDPGTSAPPRRWTRQRPTQPRPPAPQLPPVMPPRVPAATSLPTQHSPALPPAPPPRRAGELPGWGRLALAATIDALLPLLATVAVVCLEASLRGLILPPSRLGWLERGAVWLHGHPDVARHALAVLLLAALGHTLLGGVRGKTAGRWVTGLRLITPAQGQLAPRRAALRSLLCLVSAAPCFAGFYWAVLDPQRCCLHDRLGHTRCVVDG